MKKAKDSPTSGTIKKIRPALSEEAREKQMISLAVDLAEKQLLEGTASSQVITHYLKLGSTRERLERERLEYENKLTKAKTEAIESGKHLEELYLNAVAAMKAYSGNGEPDDY